MPFTILVIDDDPEFREMTTALLKSDGHWALSALSGEDGLVMVRAIRPDLILLDYHMPGMDGLAVMQQLQADPSMRRIPVVALTSATAAAQANALTQAGCIGFIPKPFDPAEFLHLIVLFLHESAARTRPPREPRSRDSAPN